MTRLRRPSSCWFCYCLLVLVSSLVPSHWTFIAAAASLQTAESVFAQQPLPHDFWLGVTVDAGRHYFPIGWLQDLLNDMHTLGFNLLHLRLTDDQAFRWHVPTHPNLAFPVLDGSISNSNSNHTTRTAYTYTPDELQYVVMYAKQRNITVVPEIHLPGHAGGWAGFESGSGGRLVVNCPQYICNIGRGVPLNISHEALPSLLKDVVEIVLEIFGHPPFLHLGGGGHDTAVYGKNDYLAQECWQEVGENAPNYTQFEDMLSGILQELKYPETQVIRWDNGNTNDNANGDGNPYRVGHIRHVVQYPSSSDGQEPTRPFFVSPKGLAMNTNAGDTGWDVYQATRQVLGKEWPKKTNNEKHQQQPFQGIIVGTMELGPKAFVQRNVFGRLLAVRMAVDISYSHRNQPAFELAYRDYCHRFPRTSGDVDETNDKTKMCNLLGAPNMDLRAYAAEWNQQWQIWKTRLCRRLTISKQVLQLRQSAVPSHMIQDNAYRRYWDTLAEIEEEDLVESLVALRIPSTIQNRSLLVNPKLDSNDMLFPYRGIVFDLVQDLVPPARLQQQLLEELMVPLGLNWLQLSLVTGEGFSMKLESNPRLYHMHSVPYDSKPYRNQDLHEVVQAARTMGIQVIPELDLSTNAGGWFQAGFLAECPKVLCDQGNTSPAGDIAHDVTNGGVFPLLLSVIQDMHGIFNTSEYIHLGRDERQESQTCWNESGKVPDYNLFEDRLSYLLQLQGLYDQQHILRWENQEQVRYPKRTGEVTHYRHLGVSVPPLGASNANFFGTVAVSITKDIFQVYQETRQWLVSKPTGLLAKIEEPLQPHSNNDLGQRLLAFSIGTMDRPTMGQATFETYFAATCHKTPWCQAPKKKMPPRPPPKVLAKQSDRQKLCNLMTKTLTIPVAREHVLSAKELLDEGTL